MWDKEMYGSTNLTVPGCQLRAGKPVTVQSKPLQDFNWTWYDLQIKLSKTCLMYNVNTKKKIEIY